MLLTDFYAWQLLDDSTMVGKIIRQSLFEAKAVIERIDGTRCYVATDKLRQATEEDFHNAVAFFANIGN